MGHFDWAGWDELLRNRGVVIERPKGSAHPRYPESIYPFDYGYMSGTVGGDGHVVDVFAGDAETGLVVVVLTHDKRKDDLEIKLLWNLTEADIEEVVTFLFSGGVTGSLMRRIAGS